MFMFSESQMWRRGTLRHQIASSTHGTIFWEIHRCSTMVLTLDGSSEIGTYITRPDKGINFDPKLSHTWNSFHQKNCFSSLVHNTYHNTIYIYHGPCCDCEWDGSNPDLLPYFKVTLALYFVHLIKDIFFQHYYE